MAFREVRAGAAVGGSGGCIAHAHRLSPRLAHLGAGRAACLGPEGSEPESELGQAGYSPGTRLAAGRGAPRSGRRVESVTWSGNVRPRIKNAGPSRGELRPSSFSSWKQVTWPGRGGAQGPGGPTGLGRGAQLFAATMWREGAAPAWPP